MHDLLYVLLLAMPVVGYIANSAYGAPTPFFGLFELPPIVGEERSARDATVHNPSLGGMARDPLVLMHVGAALYHQFIRRDNVLQRMLPRAMGGF